MPFVPKAQGTSFKAKEREKNLGEKAADFLGFTNFGKGIATLGVDRDQLDRDTELASQVQSAALARRKANAALGKDTSRLDKALQDSLASQRQIDAVQLANTTGDGLSNREVLGSALSVAATIPASMGVGALKGVVAKRGFVPAIKTAAIDGAVAGGLGGAGFGLQDKNQDAGGVIGSALGGAAAGAILGPAVGLAAAPIGRAVARLTPEARKAADAARLDKLVGAISQGKPEEIDAARKAYSSLDIEGITTFKDLRGAIDDKIAETSNGLDSVISLNHTRRPLQELTAEVKVGDESVTYNYVDDALDQLEDFYTKTNDVAGQARLAKKRTVAETDGLTVKEVNDLAKEHGAVLNAYNANGQLASGLSKQAAENTRTGLKATARQEFGDPVFQAADKEISNLIKARDLSDKMIGEVQKLQNKISDRAIGAKVARFAYQAIDLLTLRGLSGLTQAALGRGTGLKTFNALDLERQLEKNLRDLQKLLNKNVPDETLLRELEDFITRQGQASALPASQPNTISAASTAKKVVIPRSVAPRGKVGMPLAVAGGITALAAPTVNQKVGEYVDESVATADAPLTAPQAPVQLPQTLPKGTYLVRDVEVDDNDIQELRNILYSEVGNRSQDKRALESRVVINTALNRLKENQAKGRGPQTLSEILKQDNQYQGYNTKQYAIAMNGKGNEKKLAAIDAVLEELKSGTLEDNTNGAFYYIHNDDETITYDDKRPLYAE